MRKETILFSILAIAGIVNGYYLGEDDNYDELEGICNITGTKFVTIFFQ